MEDIYVQCLGVFYNHITIWKSICVTEPVRGMNLVIHLVIKKHRRQFLKSYLNFQINIISQTPERNAMLTWHSVSSLQKGKQFRSDTNLDILEPGTFCGTLIRFSEYNSATSRSGKTTDSQILMKQYYENVIRATPQSGFGG